VKRRGWQNETTSRPAGLLRRPRALRALVWLAAGALGALAGALRGEELLARWFPERSSHVRFAVIGNLHASGAELVAAAGVAPTTSLRALDLVAVRAALAGHPWVRSARVAALPPDQLILAVEEREPVAVAQLAGVVRLVDRDGTAFAPAAPDAQLPELRGAGAPGGPPLAEGVALLTALRSHGLRAPRALILGGAEPAALPALELAADAPAPGARVLLGRDDRDRKLARLAGLLRSGPPELGQTAEIDLRFGGDVILRPRPEPADGDQDEAETETRVSKGSRKGGKPS
jgi:cell division protein FtsQ